MFEAQKLIQTYYQCLESTITAHLNYSFLLTSTLKPTTNVYHGILVPTRLIFNPNLLSNSIPM